MDGNLWTDGAAEGHFLLPPLWWLPGLPLAPGSVCVSFCVVSPFVCFMSDTMAIVPVLQ